MTVVGHWNSLSEAQKLVNNVLLQGVVEEIIKQGQLLPMLPVTQLNGLSLDYNREVAVMAASFLDIHQQIPWTADVTYSPVSVALKRVAIQRAIDNFIKNTYRNPNDMRAIAIAETIKGVVETIEDKLIYGDKDNTSALEFDGLHAIINDTQSAVAVANLTEGVLNIDGGSTALSLNVLRLLLDSCKVYTQGGGTQGVFILMPNVIARYLDQAYQESGFVRSSVTVSMGSIQYGDRQIGGRIMYFGQIPIIRTDYLVAEQADTGLTSATARAKHSSSTANYSIFVIRAAPITPPTGGLSLIAADPDGESVEGFSFVRRTSFPVLENYDAGGERLVSYLALGLGATKALGRIADVTAAAPTP